MTSQAKALVQSLLHLDPRQRCAAAELASHPWVRTSAARPNAFPSRPPACSSWAPACSSWAPASQVADALDPRCIEELNIGTTAARLPERLGQLASLTALDVSGCRSLTALPAGLGQLPALRKLSIKNCWGLTSLPDVSALPALDVDTFGKSRDSTPRLPALARALTARPPPRRRPRQAR